MKLPRHAEHLTPTEVTEYQRLLTERMRLKQELRSIDQQRNLLRRRAYKRKHHGYVKPRPVLIPYAGKES